MACNTYFVDYVTSSTPHFMAGEARDCTRRPLQKPRARCPWRWSRPWHS